MPRVRVLDWLIPEPVSFLPHCTASRIPLLSLCTLQDCYQVLPESSLLQANPSLFFLLETLFIWHDLQAVCSSLGCCEAFILVRLKPLTCVMGMQGFCTGLPCSNHQALLVELIHISYSPALMTRHDCERLVLSVNQWMKLEIFVHIYTLIHTGLGNHLISEKLELLVEDKIALDS